MEGNQIERALVSVIRVPIVGLRKPITGLRKPITAKLEPLNWDDLYEGLNNYIKYAAKNVASSTSNSVVTSAEDLYQEGLLLLYKCYEKYMYKPRNEFEYLFKASIWRLLRNIAYKNEFTLVDLDTAYDIGYDDTTLSDMYEEYRLKQVVELLGDNQVALNILKEMINPSDRTVWESDMDIARKDTLKQQGFSLNVPRTVDVKGTFIQRALKITNKMYQENLRILQECVYKVYSQDREITSYYPMEEPLSDTECKAITDGIKNTENASMENDELTMEECEKLMGEIRAILSA